MNEKTIQIIALVLGLALTVLLIVFLPKTTKTYDRRAKIREMTGYAVFLALILLMTFVPNLGYIQVTPLISFTLLHLPVLLGAMLGGPKKGALLGLTFGISSYIQALSQPAGFNALFAYPWTAIPSRFLFGLIAGFVFSLIRKHSKGKASGIYLALACAGLTVLHTCLVFANLYVFFPSDIAAYLTSGSPVASGTALTFTLLILIGMAGETALAAVIVPPLYYAVHKAVPHLFESQQSQN